MSVQRNGNEVFAIADRPPLLTNQTIKHSQYLTLGPDVRMVYGLGGTQPGCSDLVPQGDR